MSSAERTKLDSLEIEVLEFLVPRANTNDTDPTELIDPFVYHLTRLSLELSPWLFVGEVMEAVMQSVDDARHGRRPPISDRSATFWGTFARRCALLPEDVGGTYFGFFTPPTPQEPVVELRVEWRGMLNPRAKRMFLLTYMAEQQLSAPETARRFDIDRSTVHRWTKRPTDGYADRSRSPIECRESSITEELAQFIVKLRLEQPSITYAEIGRLLPEGVARSSASVHRVLSRNVWSDGCEGLLRRWRRMRSPEPPEVGARLGHALRRLGVDPTKKDEHQGF